MEQVRAGGQRRIDRVLGEGFLAGLGALDLAEVRARRAEADQEETDLSYLRQLLQGRIALIEDELERRDAGRDVPADPTGQLAQVLGGNRERPPAQGAGRHQRPEPSNAGEHRRFVEQLVGDSLLTGLHDAPGQMLQDALGTLRTETEAVSQRRGQVQQVADALGQEIARRYRDGEADVDALLAPRSGREI
ncbi:MAG TPA: aerial mycelium formation protein [Mycobacteriales bacterium]|jgi:hypothetical protein|nr:aerial mycelium formation protein [Mycobacteriales bacterium]